MYSLLSHVRELGAPCFKYECLNNFVELDPYQAQQALLVIVNQSSVDNQFITKCACIFSW